MAKQEQLNITILNWDKFNPRRDLKQPHWFRVENSLFEDSDFFDFSHAELALWIYLLCQSCKKNCETCTLNVAHAKTIGRFKDSEINSALEKLQAIGCIEVIRTDPYGQQESSVQIRTVNKCSQYATRRDETERDETNATNETNDADAPFGSILHTTKVSVEVQQSWLKTYQDASWIELELKKAQTWMLANKRKAPKSNFERFYSGWLSRGWEQHRTTIIPIRRPFDEVMPT